MLITGANTQTPACALSTVTGIPLIRLRGDRRSLEYCKKTIQFSPGYRDYGHASLDILNSFGWKTIALVFDGKDLILPTQYSISPTLSGFASFTNSFKKKLGNRLGFIIFLCVIVLEESLQEAAYFRAISQKSKLAVDLVQLTKPNENEDTTAPALRAMEEIKKFEAEAILLFIDKENVKLMLQQVIFCRKLYLLSYASYFFAIFVQL